VAKKQPDERIARTHDLVVQICPLLAGQGPAVQSAVLADLLALHLCGYPAEARGEALALHLGLVDSLIPLYEPHT
jgi:hypothetical protein